MNVGICNNRLVRIDFAISKPRGQTESVNGDNEFEIDCRKSSYLIYVLHGDLMIYLHPVSPPKMCPSIDSSSKKLHASPYRVILKPSGAGFTGRGRGTDSALRPAASPKFHSFKP